MKTKKLVALVLVAVLAITSMVGTTLAWFSDSEKAVNVMAIGEVNIDLEERTKDSTGTLVPFENNKVVPLLPMSDEKGQVAYNKVVDVYNDGPNDAYVRTFVAYEKLDLILPAGYTMTENNAFDEFVGRGWTNQVDETYLGEFVISGKTYYVAQYDQIAAEGETEIKALKKGEKVQSIQSVWLEGVITQEMLGKTAQNPATIKEMNVLVLAQGVQADGFDNYAAAMASFGNVNENIVNWFANAYDAVINDHATH